MPLARAPDTCQSRFHQKGVVYYGGYPSGEDGIAASSRLTCTGALEAGRQGATPPPPQLWEEAMDFKM